MSSILVPKIAPKPIQDRFDASESSPDSLKIDFGAPKTRPRRQEAAWGFQNGSQTDFRSLKTSPRRLYDQTNAFGFIFKRWARSSQLRRSNLAVHSSTFIAKSSHCQKEKRRATISSAQESQKTAGECMHGAEQFKDCICLTNLAGWRLI